MTTTKEIGLWLDKASEDEPHWIVSRDDESSSHTIASYSEEDYADALIHAKDECHRTGCPVVQTDQHGNRETIYSIDRAILA